MSWTEVTQERFYEMLEVLPPAVQTGNGFLMGEPWDHSSQGLPRFSAFVEIAGKFYEFGGAMTVSAFRKLTPAEVIGPITGPNTPS